MCARHSTVLILDTGILEAATGLEASREKKAAAFSSDGLQGFARWAYSYCIIRKTICCITTKKKLLIQGN